MRSKEQTATFTRSYIVEEYMDIKQLEIEVFKLMDWWSVSGVCKLYPTILTEMRGNKIDGIEMLYYDFFRARP